MNLFRLFFKKIIEKRMRLTCTVIMYSLGAFLSLMFLTMSLNSESSIQKMYANEYANKIVFAEVSDETANIDDIFNKYPMKYSTFFNEDMTVTKLDSYEMNAAVYGCYCDSNITFPGEILAGSAAADEKNSIFVGKNILQNYNIAVNDAIGVKVQLSDEKIYTISGVYDDSQEFAPGFIIRDENINSIYGYVFCLSNVKDIFNVSKSLNNAGFKVYSHEDEINEYVSYGNNISRGFLLLTIIVFCFSVTILTSSLLQSFKDKFSFIAMLKAMGFTPNIILRFLCMESVIIWFLTSVVLVPIYFLGIQLIDVIMIKMDAKFFEMLDFNSFLKVNYAALIEIVLLMLFGNIAAGIFCNNRLKDKQVTDILCEDE